MVAADLLNISQVYRAPYPPPFVATNALSIWKYALDNDFDGLIYSGGVPNVWTVSSEAARIKYNMMPFVMYNRQKTSAPTDILDVYLHPSAFVGQNDVTMGYEVGRYLVETFNCSNPLMVVVSQMATENDVNTPKGFIQAVRSLGAGVTVNKTFIVTGNPDNFFDQAVSDIVALLDSNEGQAYDSIFAEEFSVVPIVTAALSRLTRTRSRPLKVGSVDFNSNVVPLIRNSTLHVSAHQQPFMQGYLSYLYLYPKVVANETLSKAPFGNVQTGPILVNPSNIDLYAGSLALDSARAMPVRTTRRRAIAIIHISDSDPYREELLRGVKDAASHLKYDLTIAPVTNSYSLSSYRSMLDAFVNNCVAQNSCPSIIISSNPEPAFALM